jgi:solute carrier family 25 oxoglutarate transporter 11
MDVSKQQYNKVLNPGEKAAASLLAGAASAFMANPFDLALIRFQADGALPVSERRNYKNVFNAVSRITAEEGFFNLWKGATPTIVRAMALNLGMLAPYEECKQRLKPYWGTGYKTCIASSFVAGFLAAFLCLPFDNIKTKVQKMKRGADGKLPYQGFFDCFKKSIRNEGLSKLWVGFPVFYVRIGGHAMLTLLISDSLKYLTGMRA